MNEQSHYKQDQTKTRQSINVKSHIFNIREYNDKSKQTPTRMSSVIGVRTQAVVRVIGCVIAPNFVATDTPKGILRTAINTPSSLQNTNDQANSNNNNVDDINSIHHPLYFHQNDHPGLILISKKLTGSENYSTWKRFMMIALNARNKLKLVNGEYEEHVVNSPIRSLWERVNDMLKGLLDELDALEAPYACVCPCDCTNGRNNGERDQRKRLMQFLMGLDENYTNVREGHYGEECYKIVGYPPGHPLHNKYVPPSQRNNSNSRINAVNQVSGSDNANPTPPNYSDIPSTSTSTTPTNAFVNSRMDQLQNQINQVNSLSLLLSYQRAMMVLLLMEYFMVDFTPSTPHPHQHSQLSTPTQVLLICGIQGLDTYVFKYFKE
ncbi:cysteine-rich receptor-like protein kinase 8 [Tanacetum coccineum]|uniref:Cysteine-rich receptor-like protein kinase 8 n=1 Tax=Tanacetum coccineum TaxID=301880 RepID=A0ABQ5HCP5_9ASTR